MTPSGNGNLIEKDVDVIAVYIDILEQLFTQQGHERKKMSEALTVRSVYVVDGDGKEHEHFNCSYFEVDSKYSHLYVFKSKGDALLSTKSPKVIYAAGTWKKAEIFEERIDAPINAKPPEAA